MKRISSITSAALLLALMTSSAAAQWNVARFGEGTARNRVYSTFGLDPSLVTAVGYARVLPVFDHPFQLTGDVGAVTAGMDVNDFRARLGAQTSMLQWRSMYLTGSATFITRGTQNSVYRGLNFGADVAGALGLYRQRWFVATDGGFDKAIITHVTHTDWYRKYFYPDAKDGWYLDAGGTYHYGMTGGATFGRAEVMGRFGWQRTERYKALTPPMYTSVGVGFGF